MYTRRWMNVPFAISWGDGGQSSRGGGFGGNQGFGNNQVFGMGGNRGHSGAGMIFDGIGGLGAGMQQMGGTFRLTGGAHGGNVWSPRYYSSGWRGGSVARITTYSMANWGRSMGFVGTGLGVGQMVHIMYQDDWSFNREAQLKAAMTLGSSLGAKIGAGLGAKAFGFGAIPGAIGGSWIGGQVAEFGFNLFNPRR